MLATRTFVFASLVVGVVSGIARGEPTVAIAPGTPDGSGAPPSTTDAPPGATAVTPPKPTGTFSIGASYASNLGFAATADISQSNLFHTGTALSLDATVAERMQRYDMKFVDPHIASNRLALTVDVYSDRRLLGATDTWRSATGVDISLSTQVADHARAFVGYRIEDVKDTGVIAWLRAGTGYSTLNSALAPTRGTSTGVDVSIGEVDDGLDLVRIDAWFNTHQALGPFIAHTGGRVSAIDSSAGESGVPATELMYFGGPNDIRGLGFGQGAGAAEPSNIIATWRSELELPVGGGVSARGFWDVGTLVDWNGAGILSQSVGGGVLWRSPIGPISVDYAVPFYGTGPRWLFAFGQTF